jgi:hypothetical protein
LDVKIVDELNCCEREDLISKCPDYDGVMHKVVEEWDLAYLISSHRGSKCALATLVLEGRKSLEFRISN